MVAKILNFPTKQSLDEEIDDQYEAYYANEDLANSNSINNTTNWMKKEKCSNSNGTITITIPIGFIQFILFIITVVAILVLCFFEGRYLKI